LTGTEIAEQCWCWGRRLHPCVRELSLALLVGARRRRSCKRRGAAPVRAGFPLMMTELSALAVRRHFPSKAVYDGRRWKGVRQGVGPARRKPWRVVIVVPVTPSHLPCRKSGAF
jgi:hypothetical protein